MAVPTLRDCATLLLKGGVRRFDRNLVMWDIPTHMSTVTADSRRRVPLPVRPGERLDVQTDVDGRIILRRLRPTPAEIRKMAPIGKLKRDKKSGLLICPMKMTGEQLAALVREDRELQ